MKRNCRFYLFLFFLPVFLTLNQTALLAGDVFDNTLSQRAYDLANQIFNNAEAVEYEHKHRPAGEQINFHDDNSCSAKTDCSGFISYVLDKVAHKHYEVIRRLEPQTPYPQAKTFAEFFCNLSSDSPYKGWIGVKSVSDLRRGDIIAWEKGSVNGHHKKHGNSGHVMMVIDPPSAAEGNCVNVYVLDSSSVYHFKPESLPPKANQDHRDGVGKGCIRLILDNSGKPIGYWEGVYWGEGHKDINKPAYTDVIGFARLVPLNP